MLKANADALIDLTEVLTLAGQDAGTELEQALALYGRQRQSRHGERTREARCSQRRP